MSLQIQHNDGTTSTVSLPYFARDIEGNYYCLAADNVCIVVQNLPNSGLTQINTWFNPQALPKVHEHISQSAFQYAYNKALNHIQSTFQSIIE